MSSPKNWSLRAGDPLALLAVDVSVLPLAFSHVERTHRPQAEAPLAT